MTAHIWRRALWSLSIIAVLILTAGCRGDVPEGTPDYPVTVIAPHATMPSTQPTLSPASPSPEPSATPTLDWDAVTLLPPRTIETDPEAQVEVSPEPQEGDRLVVPDPLTEGSLELLAAATGPYTLSDAEISLGRVLLPLDLIAVSQQGPFTVRSIPVENYPDWRFLAFSLPLPQDGELGAVVRAPIDGVVWDGMMQMVNGQTVRAVNIDRELGEGQLVRASLTYTGTIEPLFVMRQSVEAGDVLFRLTRDTGRLELLGSTIILGGATLTLHVSIDMITSSASGIEELTVLRGTSLTPASFVRDQQGLVISPTN